MHVWSPYDRHVDVYRDQIGADKKEKPLTEVTIVKAMVFTNPIPEADDQLEQFIRSNMQARIASSKNKAVSSFGSNGSSSSSSTPADANKIRRLA